MVNFSASIAASPRSAGTDAGANDSTTTGEAEGAGNGDSAEEKADATQQQREEAVRSMSSEGNPFDLDGKKPEAAHSGDGDGDGVEEVFMVDVPAAEEIEPPSWMMASSSAGGGGATAVASTSTSPSDKAFNFHRGHDRPSESSLSAAAAGEGSSEKSKKKKKKKKTTKRADGGSDDETFLTLASSASAAHADGSRKGTHHRDDYEVMLEAMDRTTSGGAAHRRRRADDDGGSVVSAASYASGRSSVTPKVALTNSRDDDSDDSAYEYVFGGNGGGVGIISSDNTATTQSIIDMSSRGEELSDVQIYHPQEQVEVDAPDAAAGGAAPAAAPVLADVRKIESFGQGGRKSSKAEKVLSNFADGAEDGEEDEFAEIDGLKAPSQGDVNEVKTHRSKSGKRHGYTRSRGDRRKKDEGYNSLALDEETATIAKNLHSEWGQNEMESGGGATGVSSPEMTSNMGLSPSSAQPRSATSRSSSVNSSSAAIEAIKKLGKSVARRVSAPDARYLQIDVTNGKAVVGQSKSSASPSRVGSMSHRSNEDMEVSASNFLFDDHEIKDYDTAQAELDAKKKQRARLSKSQWGDGTRRASYDGFQEEEGCSDDGTPRRKSTARVGPTTWAFLAERYALSTNFSKSKKRRLDDDGIIDDEDLNDNGDTPSPQGHGDLDVIGWTTPFFDRKKRRQRIFWATTGIIIGLAFLIGGLMIAGGHGRNQASDSYTDDISDFYTNIASGGTGVTPTDSGWQETPDGNLNENSRDPGPQRPLETPESTTGTGAGTQLDVEHTLTARDIQKMLSQVTPESVLLDPTSPQYSAMQWLLDDIDSSLVYFATSGYSERIIQRYTLAVVYHATGGPWGAWETDELWLTEEDECQWFGVRCGISGETEEIVMQSPGGPGRLRRGAEVNTPQDIVQSQVTYDEESMLSASSSYVTFLDLSNNGLEGVIPEEIGTLWKLGQLLLFDNNIGGAIPWGALTKLQSLHTLYLDRNRLTGNIPNSIGQLSSLKNLDLSGNKLSSSLPNALGNLLDLVVSRCAVRRMRKTAE